MLFRRKIILLSVLLLVLFLSACKPKDINSFNSAEAESEISMYSSYKDIIAGNELHRYKILGLTFGPDQAQTDTGFLFNSDYTEIESRFRNKTINMFAVPISEFELIYGNWAKNPESWKQKPVLVCVISRSGDSWAADKVIGVVIGEEWIKDYPAQAILFIGALLDSDEFVTENESERIGRVENFRLFGIEKGNALKRFAELDKLISLLARESVNRDILNALTNPMFLPEAEKLTISDIELLPKNIIKSYGNDIITENNSEELDNDDNSEENGSYNFSIVVSKNDRITLSAKVYEPSQTGDVTFRWYNDEEKIIATDINYSFKIDDTDTEEYIFYVEAVHIVKNIYDNTFAVGDRKQIKITVEHNPDENWDWDFSSTTDDDDEVLYDDIILPGDEEANIILRWNVWVGDSLTLNVGAVQLGDAESDEGENISFDYLWYKTDSENPVVEGDKYNVDTSVSGEFVFYVVATKNGDFVKKSGLLIVTITERSPPISEEDIKAEDDERGELLPEQVEELIADPEYPEITATITLRWTVWVGDQLNLSVKAIDGFKYQWYSTTDNKNPKCVGNVFSNIDTTEPGEFIFYVVATGGTIEKQRVFVSVIIKEKPPETKVDPPIITIRQEPESSNIVKGDPPIKLIAETQYDNEDDSEIYLTYQWYDSNGLLSGKTEKELIVATNQASIFVFYVKVTYKEISNISSPEIITITEPGQSSSSFQVSFTGDIVELTSDQEKQIKNFFETDEKIINAKKIVQVRVYSYADRDYLQRAYDRRMEVSRAVGEILQFLEIDIKVSTYAWDSVNASTGANVTILVTVEN